MKPQTSRSRNTKELLEILDGLMASRKYSDVDHLLTENPELIHKLTAKCEVPLVMAIQFWDVKLVEICMRHGADPNSVHECSKDNKKPKSPLLIANDEFRRRTITHASSNDQAWDKNFNVYRAILGAMVCTNPFPQGR